VRVQIISDLDGFRAIEKEWREAVRADQFATIHVSFTWLHQWLTCFGAGRKIHLMVARDTQGLLGFAPFMREERRFGWFKIPVLRLIGNELSSRSGVVLLRREAEVIAATFEALSHVSWWYIDFGRVREASAARHFVGPSGMRECWVQHRRSYLNPVVELDSNWEDYLRSRSSNFRKSLKKARRRGKRLVTKHFPSNGVSLDEIFDDMKRVAATSWQAASGTSLVDSPAEWAFYEGLLRSAVLEEGCLIVCLYDEKKPIAFATTISFNGILFGLKTGYDQEAAHLSPGFLVFAALIEAGFASHASRLDLDPVADHGEYKYRWATEIETLSADYLFRRRPLPIAIGAVYALRRWFQTLAGRRAEVNSLGAA
jgi:CelD/BcsL family acetyltransferase involved in cellulose biosynthesis